MSVTDRLLWVALAVGMAGFVLGGCASRSVRPDEMSAENHRAEAARENWIADAERSGYDPNARMRSRAQTEGTPPTSYYNPTERHLRAAQEHANHAREHQAAAAALEHFENAACAGIGAGERAACPVMTPLAVISDIEGGVRLQPADAARVAPLAARMRCHLAYARSRAQYAAPDCPLYMKGVEIRVSADGRSIEMVAGDAKTIEELRRRVRAEASTTTVL